MGRLERRGGLSSAPYLEFQMETPRWVGPQRSKKNDSGRVKGLSALLVSSTTTLILPVFCGHFQTKSCKNLYGPTHTLSTDVQQENTLPSCFTSYTVNSLRSLFFAAYLVSRFHIFVLSVGDMAV